MLVPLRQPRLPSAPSPLSRIFPHPFRHVPVALFRTVLETIFYFFFLLPGSDFKAARSCGSGIQILGSHQQLQAELTRDLHVGHFAALFVFFVVVKVFDYFL